MTLPPRPALAVVAGVGADRACWCRGGARLADDRATASGVAARWAVAACGICAVDRAQRASWSRARERAGRRSPSTGERERIARDLHDILGHSLTVITVKAELAGRLLERRPRTGPARRDRRRGAAGPGGAGRRAGHRAGHPGACRWPASSPTPGRPWRPPASTPTCRPPSTTCPPRHRELFAWAMREGVTNVVRHAGASWCGVRLTRRPRRGARRRPRPGSRAAARGTRAGRAARAGRGGRRPARDRARRPRAASCSGWYRRDAA